MNNSLHHSPRAYRRDQPYLFVSYSRQDNIAVHPEIDRLTAIGFRIWYDEGITPGKDWPDEIANAIEKSAMFVVFISPNAVNSSNVRNEIHYALNTQKPFLAIYLQQTKLPPGLELRMGDIQAIFKYKIAESEYQRIIEAALPALLRLPIEKVKELEIEELLLRILKSQERWELEVVETYLSEDRSQIIAEVISEFAPWEARDFEASGWKIPDWEMGKVVKAIKMWEAKDEPEHLKKIARSILHANRMWHHEGQPISQYRWNKLSVAAEDISTPQSISTRFVRLESLMSELLAELRNDLTQFPLRREFVLLKRNWSYWARGDDLVYYFDDHSELHSKVQILQNEGLVRGITYNNVARYVITEEFAGYLIGK